MKPSLVSVVIANYNYGAFIGQAIESALRQTHGAVEVIVVDDGSTDSSAEVAERYPVKFLRQANQGVSAARNHGAIHARGDFIMFLDADDELRADYVARCLDALASAPAHIAYAYTQMEMFGAESGIFPSRAFDHRALLRGNFVHASALMRREVFMRAGGFDPGWRLGHEDHELWVRLLSMGWEGVFVPEPLLRYRRHRSSRNTLSDAQKDELQWRLQGTYPGLYLWLLWRRPFKTLKFLYWILRIRRMNAAGEAAPRRRPLAALPASGSES